MTDAPYQGWYKDAIIYELHVKSFFDSNGDGVGDFPGLIQKLDYIARLGATAIWLLPFYPSPLKDDGYDIADYRGVHPSYGKLRDIRRFVREAHARGLRVITELVCNHTSEQHPWFQRARRARPGTIARDFYVWSDTEDRYPEARIIFKDFESSNWTWDPVAQAFYWHRFYSHQPDLNFDNPRVREEVLKVVDYWLAAGVDGLRLDAIPYLFERDGTNCENLPESHGFLKQLRRHVDQNFANRMLLAEANQWPEDAAAYFGEGTGDECHMAFHFPVMPRLFMALRMEDRFPIVDILAQTPTVPEDAQWALFLRNHDELTLEMVTDEERDYMYRAYTSDPEARINLGIRRRLGPLLHNNRRRIELMNSLLLSLPGTPVIYYGDEIGMGDNIYLGDRDSVRTPMQWSADRNAGFSVANRQRLYLPVILDPEYHYEAVNVATQEANPQSLLNWMKRLIALRKKHPAFGRGSFQLLAPENRRVLAFVREYEGERILVVANLSRYVQYAELDMQEYAGMTPVELFGRTEFPRIGELPYLITLGPHNCFWFTLEGLPPYEQVQDPMPALSLNDRELARSLPAYLVRQRWYGARARQLTEVGITDSIPIGPAEVKLVETRFTEGDPQTYVLPLQPNEKSEVVDALGDAGFASFLLESVARRRRFRGRDGDIIALPTPQLRREPALSELPAMLPHAEQSNTSVIFGDRLIMKLYRHLEEGVHPDLEVSRFLTERGFPYCAPVAGALLYRCGPSRTSTLAMLQAFVPNQGDAWESFVRELEDCAEWEPDRDLHYARLLGLRSAQLHLALASELHDPAFKPEPTTMMNARSTYQSIRSLGLLATQLLRRQLGSLPKEARPLADRVLAEEGVLHERLRRLLNRRITARRIRCHGDYHLGQVLFTSADFVIVDFEGEPARPLADRRFKRWPMRDVAGMLRSFAYAGEMAAQVAGDCSRQWARRMANEFLTAYLTEAQGGAFLPADEEEYDLLLDCMLIEKALYELRYELDHRPDWVAIPLRGLVELLEERQ
ncbi:MAG: maltose alpha-D-glucosyltransferase [Candidatus Dormibacteraeota bacterium]|nr:maltose alpha-D-glucosyltransferase [Candidatus Dormibacteraeota bacterium]